MLGAFFAILSAGSFALNNAALRRGVVSGTPIQAMAITVPLGVVCFLPLALITGELTTLRSFPGTGIGWLSAVGVVHFVIGRYCNFRANAVAGVNLTAPVVQLQVLVTMFTAVVVLHEPCTAFQMLGGILIVAGSLITQQAPARTATAPGPATGPIFVPRYVAGYVFAALAAVAYGSTPVMARFALEHTGPSTGILGGLISYAAATAVLLLAFLSPALRRNAAALQRDNAPWFVVSGVCVAAAQGFFFAAVAVAPVMLVMPLLQFSLAFRMLFSTWLSPSHEIVGPLVLAGVVLSVIGALMVSIETGLIVEWLAIPEPLARAMLWRV